MNFPAIRDLTKEIGEFMVHGSGGKDCNKILEELTLMDINRSTKNHYSDYGAYYFSNEHDESYESSNKNIMGHYGDGQKTYNISYGKNGNKSSLRDNTTQSDEYKFLSENLKMDIMKQSANPFSKDILLAYNLCNGTEANNKVYVWATGASKNIISLNILYRDNSPAALASIYIDSVSLFGVCNKSESQKALGVKVNQNIPYVIPNIKLLPNEPFIATVYVRDLGTFPYQIDFWGYNLTDLKPNTPYIYRNDSCYHFKVYECLNGLASASCNGDTGNQIDVKFTPPIGSTPADINNKFYNVGNSETFLYNGSFYRFEITYINPAKKMWGFRIIQQQN